MIKSAQTAVRISQLVQDAFTSLDESIKAVQETETQQDFEEYRHRAAAVMAGLYEYILHDLWKSFPGLEPEEMRKPSSRKDG